MSLTCHGVVHRLVLAPLQAAQVLAPVGGVPGSGRCARGCGQAGRWSPVVTSGWPAAAPWWRSTALKQQQAQQRKPASRLEERAPQHAPSPALPASSATSGTSAVAAPAAAPASTPARYSSAAAGAGWNMVAAAWKRRRHECRRRGCSAGVRTGTAGEQGRGGGRLGAGLVPQRRAARLSTPTMGE